MNRHHPLARCLIVAAAIGATTGATAAGFGPFGKKHDNRATLTYTIEISGRTHQENPGHRVWSQAEVTRRLQGTLHLSRQQADTHPESTPGRVNGGQLARRALTGHTADLEQIALECRDKACAAHHMVKLAARMAPDKRQVLGRVVHRLRDRIKARFVSQPDSGLWALDAATACSLTAVSTGASSRRQAAAGGAPAYVTRSEQLHGQADTDCRHEPIPDARAEWNGAAGSLDITLPGMTLVERWDSSDGKRGTRKVTLPDVRLEHLRWSGKGPQSGTQTRRISTTVGSTSLPATMTIRWTFEPGRA